MQDAWDADSDDEKEKKDAAKPAAAAAPAKTKKKTIKQVWQYMSLSPPHSSSFARPISRLQEWREPQGRGCCGANASECLSTPLQIAAEKEAKAKEEAEARRKAHDAARGAHEGEAIGDLEAEKARRQRLVEEADLENAKDLFDDGKPVAKKGEVVPIESMQPKTRADFEAFATAISDKLTQFEVYIPCCLLHFRPLYPLPSSALFRTRSNSPLYRPVSRARSRHLLMVIDFHFASSLARLRYYLLACCLLVPSTRGLLPHSSGRARFRRCTGLYMSRPYLAFPGGVSHCCDGSLGAASAVLVF